MIFILEIYELSAKLLERIYQQSRLISFPKTLISYHTASRHLCQEYLRHFKDSQQDSIQKGFSVGVRGDCKTI